MKRETIKWATTIVKLLGGLTAFAGVAEALPPQYTTYGVVAFLIASTVKDALINIVDALDDGKLNKSFTGK